MGEWQAMPAFGTVKWQVHNYENHTNGGTCSLYFGNASADNYNNPGQTVSGTAISPEIDVSGFDSVEVSFWLWQDLEDVWKGWDDLSFVIDQQILQGMDPLGLDIPLWKSPCSLDTDSQCQTQPPTSPCDQDGCANVEMGTWKYHSYVVPVETIFDDAGGWTSPIHIVRFKFGFNSGDAGGNEGVGIFVDDFKVKTICD